MSSIDSFCEKVICERLSIESRLRKAFDPIITKNLNIVHNQDQDSESQHLTRLQYLEDLESKSDNDNENDFR